MKFRFLPLALAAIFSVACTSQPQPQDQDFILRDGWQIHADGSETSYKACVPSTVIGTLTQNGKYTDAFVGTKYYDEFDRDDFAMPWWYETEFSMPALKDGQRVSLDFDGISYSAEVWLNDHQLASRDEMKGPFRQYSFDVTDIISENNKLSVKLFRAEDGEFNIGFVDWNPRAADESMGIFREVWVRYSDAVSVKHTAVKSKVDTEKLDKAWLTVETTLSNASESPVTGTLALEMGGKTFHKKVTLAAGEEKTVSIDSKEAKILALRNPRLWWCHNLGTPEMYHMDVTFSVDGKVSDEECVNFGVRQIESYLNEDGHRGFILNGKKVLIKGAGWTDDIFLRNPDCRNDIELDYVKDMNLNTVRFENIWGTSQNVYDLCDEKGLLALVGWSCFWEWEVYSRVPNDKYGCIKEEADMDLIAASLKDQVLWLRNHPSIIAWYVGSDDLPRPELEKRYLEILPKYDDRPYVASAKGLVSELTGPTGMKMVGPYDYQGPEYWYNPVAPGGAFGFNTETGIGAQLPMRESIEKMIPQDQLWPVGAAYDFHCTVAGEDMHSLDVLKEVIGKRYGPANDLDEFLLQAHHLDYDGTRAMFEAFRVNAPKATGVIQWMLNSAWPSMYWQLYDWYLQPVASYYSVKKACAPQQLIYNYFDKHIYAANDEATDFSLRAKAEVYAADGILITKAECDAEMPAGASTKLFEIPQVEQLSFLFLTLEDKAGNEVETNYYLLSPVDDIHDWKNYNWIRTRLSQHSDFTGLAELGAANVSASVNKCGDGIEVTLTNDSALVAFFTRLSIKDSESELVTPAFWSENMVSLKPGETRTVTCKCELPANGTVTISGWNVEQIDIKL